MPWHFVAATDPVVLCSPYDTLFIIRLVNFSCPEYLFDFFCFLSKMQKITTVVAVIWLSSNSEWKYLYERVANTEC